MAEIGKSTTLGYISINYKSHGNYSNFKEIPGYSSFPHDYFDIEYASLCTALRWTKALNMETLHVANDEQQNMNAF